ERGALVDEGLDRLLLVGGHQAAGAEDLPGRVFLFVGLTGCRGRFQEGGGLAGDLQQVAFELGDVHGGLPFSARVYSWSANVCRSSSSPARRSWSVALASSWDVSAVEDVVRAAR